MAATAPGSAVLRRCVFNQQRGAVSVMATKSPESPEVRPDIAGMKIKWDDSAMKSSYANVCNVTSTREEVVMLFGVNRAWNRGQ